MFIRRFFINYSIGEFSKITNLSIYTLRYYEEEELITPSRKSNGHRSYNDSDLRWIEFVQRLKDTGMPIKDIKNTQNCARLEIQL